MSYIQLLIFTFAVILTLSGFTSGAKPCDENGRCKYGGRCGGDNMCYCSFSCTKPSWDISMKTLYCNPKKGSKSPEIFQNICFLMTRACELQEDIPVIKFNFFERTSRQCQGKAKNADRWGLCPNPEDFMGPCGGTLSRNGFSPDAGVCLKDKLTQRTRCECPNTKTGEDCQVKFVMSQASTKQKRYTDDPKSEASGVMPIVISVLFMGGMLIGIIIFLLIRSRSNSKCTNDVGKLDKTEFDILSKKETRKQNQKETQKLSSSHCIMEIQCQENDLPSSKEDSRKKIIGGQRRQRLQAYNASMVNEENNSKFKDSINQFNNNNNSSKTVGTNPCLYGGKSKVGLDSSSDGIIYVNGHHSTETEKYFEGMEERFAGGASFYTL